MTGGPAGAEGPEPGQVDAASRLSALRGSAQGWHGVQLAVLGFIGLCGVLQGDAGEGDPAWLQVSAAVAVLLALLLACLATVLVATAAWPLYAPAARQETRGVEDEIGRTSRRLRTGIGLTFVAVAVLGVGAMSAWWPGSTGGDDGGDLGVVEVSTGSGVACGRLEEANPGVLALDVEGQRVEVPLDQVAQVRLLDSCP